MASPAALGTSSGGSSSREEARESSLSCGDVERDEELLVDTRCGVELLLTPEVAERFPLQPDSGARPLTVFGVGGTRPTTACHDVLVTAKLLDKNTGALSLVRSEHLKPYRLPRTLDKAPDTKGELEGAADASNTSADQAAASPDAPSDIPATAPHETATHAEDAKSRSCSQNAAQCGVMADRINAGNHCCIFPHEPFAGSLRGEALKG